MGIAGGACISVSNSFTAAISNGTDLQVNHKPQVPNLAASYPV